MHYRLFCYCAVLSVYLPPGRPLTPEPDHAQGGVGVGSPVERSPKLSRTSITAMVRVLTRDQMSTRAVADIEI